jgi:hypothetical protein
MAHFIRCLITFVVIVFLVYRYFKKQARQAEANKIEE